MYPSQITPPCMDWTEMDLSIPSSNLPSGGTLLGSERAPVSMNTPIRSPPRSPPIYGGPRLIPKVRRQDQMTEPGAGLARQRSHSTGHNVNPRLRGQQTGNFSPPFSPSTSLQMLTPVSVSSPCPSTSNLDSSLSFTNTPSRRPGVMHGRSVSTSAVPRHFRNLSTSSIDGSVLTRYGFPTYRNMPGNSSAKFSNFAPALSFLTPMPVPRVAHSMAFMPLTPQNTPPREATPSEPSVATPVRLSAELVYDPTNDNAPTSTLLNYLTATNPSPSLVHRIVEPARGQSTHFWYDIRNLRSWSDFNIATIANTPGLLPLLQCEIPISALPSPPRVNEVLESQSQLHELCRDHYALKVNAALKVALGTTPMAMRSLHANGPMTGSRSNPEFISNYASDSERTMTAERGQRGRVIGIVLCYEQWNSGMRSGDAAQKVKYLAGLSRLHWFLREHGSRYGFILTEIELVCVRYGGGDITPPTTTPTQAPVPNFGFLELSTPIQTCTSSLTPIPTNPISANPSSGIALTVPLALWYLHLLAKSNPLPGQHHWKLDIGGPTALTRHKFLEKRDAWMPLKPQQGEVREARRNRGWVWPGEKLSRRERGGRGRSRTVFGKV